MKTIELHTITNNNGELILQYPLGIRQKKVKVVITMDDDSDDEVYVKELSKNPAFDFLKESGEDIYTEDDGEPYGA